MKKQTFIELYLVKYGQVSQEEAEKQVSTFVELFPEKDKMDEVKCIMGILGYIKHSQDHHWSPNDTAQYIIKDMERAIDHKKNGRPYTPSCLSYRAELMGNERMPKL
ncbi:MAG: hypothetical protein PHT07_14990 [Paludibacter sp.]|nr:hypothetical protein [Paludibacter sp.]